MKTKTAKEKKLCILIAVIAIFAVAFALGASDIKLKTVYYEAESGKIKNPIKIVLITDLHSCYYGDGQSELLDEVYRQNPDLVLFGGDIIDDILPQQNAMLTLSALAKRYPCYYVSGNHEFWSGEIEDIKRKIRSLGVTVLEGESITLSIRGQKINVCGIDDAEIGERNMHKQLNSAVEEAETGNYILLLAHRPEYIRDYLQYGFDFILTGHAHGGQWRLPWTKNGLVAPDQGLFPKYSGGDYIFNDTLFVVSRGLARESTIIPRVFNPPELVVINLKAKVSN